MNRFIGRILPGVVMVLGLAGASPLAAQTPFGTACSLPANSFGGSGIPTTNVYCSVLGGVTLALSSTPRYTSPAVTTDGAGTYYAQAGNSTGGAINVGFATWNFDYYVGGATATDYFSLFLDLNPAVGVNTPGTAFSWTGNNHDSSNLGYLGSAVFDPNVAGEYSIELVQYSDAGHQHAVNRAAINVEVAAVTATPEPGSLALLATGLVGLAGLAKRRKIRATAAGLSA